MVRDVRIHQWSTNRTEMKRLRDRTEIVSDKVQDYDVDSALLGGYKRSRGDITMQCSGFQV